MLENHLTEVNQTFQNYSLCNLICYGGIYSLYYKENSLLNYLSNDDLIKMTNSTFSKLLRSPKAQIALFTLSYIFS